MKKLEQIRQKSKEIKDKIDDTEERLRQLKNQEKKILKQDIVKRRKESIIEKIKEYKLDSDKFNEKRQSTKDYYKNQER
ncbi:hypothetical protein HMPREF3181_00437 [Parvimonas sp. KA00067]|uniref:hypothetical protein n=1 Tax=Parvimonas sp. KA00067 TaxID=1588755 RepID=UPI00079A5CEA|nr:hypothetical protein [Parvimonas sp. KA00067]KXB66921.1 hypothetical protein HMPREF3181_00437 [Parvimonas sp. KA00067]